MDEAPHNANLTSDWEEATDLENQAQNGFSNDRVPGQTQSQDQSDPNADIMSLEAIKKEDDPPPGPDDPDEVEVNREANEDNIAEEEKKRHECEICGDKFATFRELAYHGPRMHPRRRPLPCVERKNGCEFRSRDPWEMHEHLKQTHRIVNKYQCARCGYSNAKANRLRLHMEAFHLKLQEFACPHCPYKASTVRFINKHIRAIHPGEEEIEKDGRQRGLPGTLNPETGELYPGEQGPTLDPETGMILTEDGQERDPTHLSPPEGLKREEDTPEKPPITYTCEDCDFTSTSYLTFNRHRRRKHEKGAPETECPHCGKVLSNAFSLQSHINVQHLGSRPFKCPHCPYRAPDASKIKVHVSSKHVANKPYSCDRCNFICSLPKNLKTHIESVHYKVKNAACPYCEYKCYSFSILRSHVSRRHKDNDPYDIVGGVNEKNNVITRCSIRPDDCPDEETLLKSIPQLASIVQIKTEEDAKFFGLNQSPSAKKHKPIRIRASKSNKEPKSEAELGGKRPILVRGSAVGGDDEEMVKIDPVPDGETRLFEPEQFAPKGYVPPTPDERFRLRQLNSKPKPVNAKSKRQKKLAERKRQIDKRSKGLEDDFIDDSEAADAFDDFSDEEADVIRVKGEPASWDESPANQEQFDVEFMNYEDEEAGKALIDKVIADSVEINRDLVEPKVELRVKKEIIDPGEDGQDANGDVTDDFLDHAEPVPFYSGSDSDFVPPPKEERRKKGRRKRKTARKTNYDEDEDDFLEQLDDFLDLPPKRKRGRPPKTKEDIFSDEPVETPCDQCDFVGMSPKETRSHKRKEHPRERYKCPKCASSFKDKTTLAKHVTAVHERCKPYRCSLCGYCCNEVAHIRSHIRCVHQKVKPFTCDKCPFSAASLKRVILHDNHVHKKIMDMRCLLCGLESYNKTVFKNHMRNVHKQEVQEGVNMANLRDENVRTSSVDDQSEASNMGDDSQEHNEEEVDSKQGVKEEEEVTNLVQDSESLANGKPQAPALSHMQVDQAVC